MPSEPRKIIEQLLDKALFAIPKAFTRDNEVIWLKIRMDAARIASYQDSHCGVFSSTFDETGAYLCAGCNKLDGKECLIRIDPVKDPQHSSCMYWEVKNSGDMEPRYCPHGKRDDERLSFGTTPSGFGFSCERCEYGQGALSMPDSEGRKRWCALKGMPVEDHACCGDNEPVDDDLADDQDEGEASSEKPKVTRKLTGNLIKGPERY